ncbi:MAG: hypothetical protein JO151_05150 [Verrucomicrobia bacterium]|nr:hypothetical protein [Verrucomicrobiota bacterium]
MSQSSSEPAHCSLNSPDQAQIDARIKNLEIENKELKQQIFDHYEWSRQQQRKLVTELECLRSISLEYRILDFLRRQIERSTGASRNALEVQTEKIKLSLVLAPRASLRWDLFNDLSEQDHKRFELVLVIDDDNTMVREDWPRIEDLKIVRVSRQKGTSARIGLGFGEASGEILGYLDEQSSLLSSGLRSVAFFFQCNPRIQVMHVPDLRETSSGWVLCETPVQIDFLSAWKQPVPDLSNFFFRRKAFEIVHGVDNRIEGAWQYATILRLLRLYPSRLNPAAVRVSLRNLSPDSLANRSIEAAKEQVRELFQKDLWKTEWIRQGLSHRISQIRSRAFDRLAPKLWFPSSSGHLPQSLHEHKVIARLPRCPTTDQEVDRFLFTLALANKPEPKLFGVFFHSASQVAALARFTGKSAPQPAGNLRSHDGIDAAGTDDWLSPQMSALGIESRLKRTVSPVGRLQDLQASTTEETYARQLATAAQEFPESPQRVLDFPSWSPWAIPWKRCIPNATAEIITAEGWQSWLKDADFGRFEETVFADIRLADDPRLFDVIHLPGLIQISERPRYLIRILANLLRWKGLLVITTPNLDSVQLELFGPAWCHWEPSQNAFVYSVHALRELMRHCGFQEVRTITFSHPEWTQASLARFVGATEAEHKADAFYSELRNGGGQQALAVEICAGVEKPMLGDCILGVFAKLY